MLAVVIDLSKLGDPASIGADVEAIKAHVRSSRVAPGFDEVLLPGEPERRTAQQRAAGIAVDDTTWRDIREAAAKLGITDGEIERTLTANNGAMQRID